MARSNPFIFEGGQARLLASGILVVGVSVTATELSYVAGVTSNIQTQLNTAFGDIATNTANIATNAANIATNTANIATNTANIATNTANIATNTANIATNTAAIATKADDSAVVHLAGTETITGAKTFSLTVAIAATTNQLVLGTTNTTTITAPAPAASRVYTIPDAGTNASFVMTAGTKTIAGATTFSSGVTIDTTTTGTVLSLQGDDTDTLNFEFGTDVISIDARNVPTMEFNLQGVSQGSYGTSGWSIGPTGSNINIINNGRVAWTRTDGTIASGSLAATSSYMRVDTQSAAATDDLDSITGGQTGSIIILQTVSSSRDVVVKNGTGNILLNGSADFTLATTVYRIGLLFDGTNWNEVFRKIP